VPADPPPGADAAARIAVRVAWSGAPGEAAEIELELPAGATLADALAAWRGATGATLAAERIGIWGRPRALSTRLKAGDRVEVWRPLQAEPMEARRARQRRQRAARPPRVTCSPRR
jgi:putative ubiquitin-RnfH superfamily antitoxin RatB of RatAB toxin-antitoxin module